MWSTRKSAGQVGFIRPFYLILHLEIKRRPSKDCLRQVLSLVLIGCLLAKATCSYPDRTSVYMQFRSAWAFPVPTFGFRLGEESLNKG
jgi:hypothetical protein